MNSLKYLFQKGTDTQVICCYYFSALGRWAVSRDRHREVISTHRTLPSLGTGSAKATKRQVNRGTIWATFALVSG